MGTAKRILGIGDIEVDDSQEPILREDGVTFSFIVKLNAGFTIPEPFKLDKGGTITGSKEVYLPFCFIFFLKKFLEYYQGFWVQVVPEQGHVSIILGSSFDLVKNQNLDGFLNKCIGVLNIDLSRERYRAAQGLKKEVANLKTDWKLLHENLKTNPNNSIANQKVNLPALTYGAS